MEKPRRRNLGPRPVVEAVMGRFLLPRGLALAALMIAFAIVPRHWCQTGAGAFWSGDRGRVRAFGANVDRHVGELPSGRFSTGSRRFDGEWHFGTAMMAAMGFGQTAREHAELGPEALARMDRALDAMLSPRARAFDAEAWGEDPLASLDGDRGHAAYLGYANLALSVRRFIEPESRFAALNDRISATLERRLAAADAQVIETYPGEIYPVDNAAVAASIALRARALGQTPPAVVDQFLRQLRERFVDPKTGLLHQSLGSDRRVADAPRGSGTALAAYFLSFADDGASRALHRALRAELGGTVAGFGVVREYPRGSAFRPGDIDSGPLVFGFSISAMGFGLSGCRTHGDRACFTELYRAFYLFGAPVALGGEHAFASGGPLGNAIVLAMLTAQPASAWRRA